MGKTEYVEYHQGGVLGRRPVLEGAQVQKSFDEIPLVDVTNMTSSSFEERKAVAAEVGRVCTEDKVEALEVLNKNGFWIPALPLPRTFVINIADFMQFFTNGHFASTVHRVVNKTGKERYSIPFFFAFDNQAELEVVPSCRENGKEYAKGRVGDFIRERLKLSRYRHPSRKV
ncbi:MAG: hypothetical protein M1818_003258 [Claussenomyces sp. TS43310]|nr:MAG: hypothetical protein M1818_003258 [Claussenomyces sp. TS43310]